MEGDDHVWKKSRVLEDDTDIIDDDEKENKNTSHWMKKISGWEKVTAPVVAVAATAAIIAMRRL